MQGQFNLPGHTEVFHAHAIANLSYEGLPVDLKQQFDSYRLDIIVIDDAEDDEIWELYHWLRYGNTLKA